MEKLSAIYVIMPDCGITLVYNIYSPVKRKTSILKTQEEN